MLWAKIALQICAYLWPAYQCFKAIELNRADDIKKWAKFWVIIGFFTAFQPLLDTFLFWVPFYYEATLAMAVYLWHSGLQGAVHVYQRWVQPTVLQQEPVIDQKLAEFKAQLGDTISTYFARLVELVQARAATVLQQVQLAQPKAGPPLRAERAGYAAKAD